VVELLALGHLHLDAVALDPRILVAEPRVVARGPAGSQLRPDHHQRQQRGQEQKLETHLGPEILGFNFGTIS